MLVLGKNKIIIFSIIIQYQEYKRLLCVVYDIYICGIIYWICRLTYPGAWCICCGCFDATGRARRLQSGRRHHGSKLARQPAYLAGRLAYIQSQRIQEHQRLRAPGHAARICRLTTWFMLQLSTWHTCFMLHLQFTCILFCPMG